MKKRLTSIGSILLTLCILTMNIVAVGAVAIDTSREGSISITMSSQGEIVPGGTLTLYRVAEVVYAGSGYGFAYVEPYEECEVSLNQIASAKTAQELADYTAAEAIQGRVEAIDAAGRVVFDDLELGLYLLMQEEAAEGYKSANPFLVTVPLMKDGAYDYDVDASPKLEIEKEPDTPPPPPDEPDNPPPPPPPPPEEPETPPEEPELPPEEPVSPPKEPELPQTGLTNWPIPVLAVGGAFLVVLGWYLQMTGKKKS